MVEYDNQAFRAWVIAWLNSLETVLCAHMALMTKRLYGTREELEPIVAHPKLLLSQVEDIKRALEIILEAPSEMTPQPITGEHPKVIPQEKNLPTLASVVAFKDSNRPVVGRAAQDMLTILYIAALWFALLYAFQFALFAQHGFEFIHILSSTESLRTLQPLLNLILCKQFWFFLFLI